MTTFYVATNGNDNNNGSSTSPWKTISQAMQSSSVKPGDTVIVRSGTYNEPYGFGIKSGTAAGNITLKSEVPGGAHIVTSAYAAVYMGNYTTIDGFDVKAGTHAIFANGVHHFTIKNNIAHDSGLSGIGVIWSEFITIEGNETYGNSYADWGSGISIWEPRNITGDKTTTGYRTIVRNNISHDNIQHAGNRTDGNGIIIDDFQNWQNAGYPNYTYPTLVTGNVVYNNGGKGIAVHWSDYVTVTNNTAYHNNQDNGNKTTWRGEFSQQDSAHNTWANNIGVADTQVNSANTAIGFYGGNSDTKWVNNITFNGTAGQASVNNGGSSSNAVSSTTNKLGVNPQFVDPSHGDFHLKAGSPAIDAGAGGYAGGTGVDADGHTRVVGTIDIGAYESGSTGGGTTTNHAPVAAADSGFSTTAGTALTIDDARLLANDTDSDGDSLSVTAVSGATNGTVRLNTSGDVVFTPTSGYAGPASFKYTAADGQGGSATATVSLTVTSPTTTNQAPTISTVAALSVNENVTAVTKVAATDVDGDKLTYAISGGADRALFKIDAATGQLSFVTAPDYENPKDSGANNVYNISVSVSDGVNAAVSKALAVTVKDVAEGGGTGSATSFFGSAAKPASTETGDTADYELGMRFKATVDGEISALRYYRGSADAGDTDTRAMTLWSGSTKLATATVTSTAGQSGWQIAKLSSAVDIDAGQTYTVSYSTKKNYAITENYFSSQKTSADGMLVALAKGGVYNDTPGKLPTSVWHSSSYWADVIFSPETAVADAGETTDPGTATETSTAGRTLTGTVGADVLLGTEGDDRIFGKAGADRIDGKGGADLLRGDYGRDVFVFGAVSDSKAAAPDTIADFTRQQDKIDVSAIDAVAGGSDNAFSWVGTHAFGGHAGELRYMKVASGLMIQGDVDGDGHADLAIALTNNIQALSASDFIL